MRNLDFTISCIVTFFSKKMTNLLNLNNGKYYPHIDGEDVIFDKPIRANALPVNEYVDYSGLEVGTEFFILDGSTIVGVGLVKEIFQHKPMGENNYGL